MFQLYPYRHLIVFSWQVRVATVYSVMPQRLVHHPDRFVAVSVQFDAGQCLRKSTGCGVLKENVGHPVGRAVCRRSMWENLSR